MLYNQFSADVMKNNVVNWEETNVVMEAQKEKLLKENPEILTNYSDLDADQLMKSLTNSKTNEISYLTKLDPDGMRILSGLTHYTQYYADWCGVATAQIISSKYMSPPWGQYHIGQMMGAYFPDGTPGQGTNINDELAYYQPTVAEGGLGKPSSDWEPSMTSTWENAKAEIEQFRPLKIGRVYPTAHARACNGWQVTGGNRYLLFYDPASYGSVYWEYVSPGFTYSNFVYVR